MIFASGACALAYQTTWLREFRLIFGASTAASAAVLAVFMGGLGFGSLILGRRSEAQARPLQFYAKLELMIAGSAVVTPLLIWMIRQLYLAMGGTVAMGLGLGTIVRLLMTFLVLGLPTFLMGGTLPAAARAVVIGSEDSSRRSLAFLYGINTLGAVFGTAAATFYFFETWGNHLTLYLAAGVNALVAAAAYAVSKSLPDTSVSATNAREITTEDSEGPVTFILIASAVAGFVFLLMELVWYRMLSPLLGGSTFTFGLILVVALLGIGIGGILYTFCFRTRVTLQAFAFVSGVEALAIAVPYAMGDRIALTAMLLRPLGAPGFYGHVIAWVTIAAIVAFPAAIVSGIQFPMLLALLGKGGKRVGVQTGLAYSANTVGAIVGALAGGFGLIPALSAPGVWKFVVVILCLLAVAAALIAAVRSRVFWRLLPPFAVAAAALVLLTAVGPTAFWRHSQIGAGRMTKFTGDKHSFRDLENMVRRTILWEDDGVESSVAVAHSSAIGFIVNGRTDGNARGDAGTQVMTGLLPAALHPQPTRAMVIGLGTGSTAGWLGAVPSIQQVDVVEFEPTILRVAKDCEAVNQHVLTNPKVRIIIGDGREVLLSTKQKYDVISSEPSNPYRAGIASLFTVEFYQAAAHRLNAGGLFAQWVQAYEIDARTLETVYATMGSVFPNIDTWQTQTGDLLLVGSLSPLPHDADALRARIATEPFKSGLLHVWGVTTLEGLLAHLVGNNSLTEAMKRGANNVLNTDDKTVLEFAFARNVDLRGGVSVAFLQSGTRISGADKLPITSGNVDWSLVQEARLWAQLAFRGAIDPNDYDSPELRSRAAAFKSYVAEDFKAALASWREHPHDVTDINELRMMSECMADEGNPAVAQYIETLRKSLPTEADAFLSHFLGRREQWTEATDVMEKVFHALQTDPWPGPELTQRTLKVAGYVAERSPSELAAHRLYQAVQKPFSVFNSQEARIQALLRIGIKLDGGSYGEYTLPAIEAAEPNVPWQADFLQARKTCYENTHNPGLAQAKRDWNEYLKEQPAGFGGLVMPKETKQPDKGFVLSDTSQTPTPPDLSTRN